MQGFSFGLVDLLPAVYRAFLTFGQNAVMAMDFRGDMDWSSL